MNELKIYVKEISEGHPSDKVLFATEQNARLGIWAFTANLDRLDFILRGLVPEGMRITYRPAAQLEPLSVEKSANQLGEGR